MSKQQTATNDQRLEALEAAIRDVVSALRSCSYPHEPNLSDATYAMCARPTPCPKCGSDEHIEELGTGTTLMGGLDVFWSGGQRHTHEPNKTTTDFLCQCGERWTQVTWPPCPACGWTACPTETENEG